MGIACMGKGRALLEFEFVEEARRVHLSGNKVVGGVQMGLERWNPRSGCMEEGEDGEHGGITMGKDSDQIGRREHPWVAGDRGGRDVLLPIPMVGGSAVLRQDEGWKRGLSNHPRGEVSGDGAPRAGSRVEEMVGAGFEV
ncbi:hypothetical protein CK203_047476 [Vitis vinifera]|uniref:DUF4283 domain-containing protein n=1 Tax=Vitis vinifera TaxID=29760 RepID=A0A438H5Z3_VITVI|nr:hypothetical protein CK203_047476 [Vitis vinifera]